MRDNQQLPHPIITPTTKAAIGDHDEPLSMKRIVEKGLLSQKLLDQVSEYALAMFARGQEIAKKRGLILVDTKYEFGVDRNGVLTIADEIHTPDSSRYWLESSYQASFEKGAAPESFDKDVVRKWVAAQCDPYKDPIPVIPAEFILKTSQVYIEAFEKITATPFALPSAGEEPTARIGRNIARYAE
jgi:phosphoribosylaminoimidazole-succinocarboxamide synthase